MKKNKKAPEQMPASARVEDGFLKLCEVFTYEGATVLSWEAVFPVPQIADGMSEAEKRARTRIADFYRAIAARYVGYVGTHLHDEACRAYEADTGRRKRYSFPRFRLLHKSVVTRDGDGYFSVRRTVTLLRGGRVLRQREMAEVFSLTNGALLPLWAMPQAKKAEGGAAASGGRPFRRVREGDWFLSENEICFLPPAKQKKDGMGIFFKFLPKILDKNSKNRYNIDNTGE